MDTTYYTTSVSYGSDATSLSPEAATAIWVFMLVAVMIALAVAVVSVISLWKLFTKAGKPGWASIVPIYNNLVMLEIVGRPMWWIALYFVPFANVVVAIIVALETAKVFGKDTLYGVLLILFPIPMYPILAFSKGTQYLGPIPHPESQQGYTAPAQAPVAQPGVQPSPTEAPTEQPQPPQQ